VYKVFCIIFTQQVNAQSRSCVVIGVVCLLALGCLQLWTNHLQNAMTWMSRLSWENICVKSSFACMHATCTVLVSKLSVGVSNSKVGQLDGSSKSHGRPFHDSVVVNKVLESVPHDIRSAGLHGNGTCCQVADEVFSCIAANLLPINVFHRFEGFWIQVNKIDKSVHKYDALIKVVRVRVARLTNFAKSTAAQSWSLGTVTRFIGATFDVEHKSLLNVWLLLFVEQMYMQAPYECSLLSQNSCIWMLVALMQITLLEILFCDNFKMVWKSWFYSSCNCVGSCSSHWSWFCHNLWRNILKPKTDGLNRPKGSKMDAVVANTLCFVHGELVFTRELLFLTWK
jgi:hypothetical protein